MGDEEEPAEVQTVVIVDDVSVSYAGVPIWPLSTSVLLVGGILATSLIALLVILFAGRRRVTDRPA
jgi:hypothetical protein